MDKKSWIAVILCIVLLGLWQWAYVTYYPPAAVPASRPAPAAVPTPAVPAAPAPAAPAPAAPSAAQPDASAPVVALRRQTLSTAGAEFTFVNGQGGIERVVLPGHLGEHGAKVDLNDPSALAIGALGGQPGSAFGGFDFVEPPAGGGVAFSRRFEDGLEVMKVFRPVADEALGGYVLSLEVTFRNTAGFELHRPGYFVATGAAAPEHYSDMPIYTGFDWLSEGKATYIDVNWFSASTIPLTGIQTHAAQALYEKQATQIGWAAVKNQYFTTIVAGTGETYGTGVWSRRFDVLHGGDAARHVFGIEGAMVLPGFKLAPGETFTQNFQIFAGPKELGRLSLLGRDQQDVMNFGLFSWFSEILLYSMNSLYGLLGNYAAAIIALTLIIKALLWPLQNKATDSMRRMAALSPKMTELREKYKDDPTRMNQELMKLYKDYGVNPFSGCLPMLIQIPIFFGFYSMLGTAIELRNASFLWVHDLSQPDTVAHVLGFPVNVLPLLMAATMFWQMHITPKTGDAVQQRVFMFMPLIFVVFAYNFASALSLYWTTQNLVSILQLYLTRNRPLPVLEKKSVTAKKALEAAKQKKRQSPR